MRVWCPMMPLLQWTWDTTFYWTKLFGICVVCCVGGVFILYQMNPWNICMPSWRISQILFVPSGKFIGRTFAFKKFYRVFKRGKERLQRFLNQPLIFRKNTTLWNNPQTSSFQVASLSDEHSHLKKFYRVSKGVKRGYNDSWINLSYLGKHKQSTTKLVQSGKFIGRTFAFKKVLQSFQKG